MKHLRTSTFTTVKNPRQVAGAAGWVGGGGFQWRGIDFSGCVENYSCLNR